jgi:phage terminase large subunit-like protein
MEEPWQVIRLPALAEDDDPLGRAPGAAFPDEEPQAGGEALWPERYDRPALLRIKKAVGTRAWTSNYQQRPRPLEGSLIKPHQLRYYVEEGADFILFLPDGARVRRPISQGQRFCTVDLAVSQKTTGHFFAVSAFHLTHHSELLALDAYRDRVEAPDQLRAIQAMIDKWGLGYAAIERFGYQLAIIQDARRHGMAVKELGVTPQERADKNVRAQSLAIRTEGGGLYLRRGAPWLDWVEAELTGFPVEGAAGGDFDTLDTFAYASILVSRGVAGKLQITFRSGARK